MVLGDEEILVSLLLPGAPGFLFCCGGMYFSPDGIVEVLLLDEDDEEVVEDADVIDATLDVLLLPCVVPVEWTDTGAPLDETVVAGFIGTLELLTESL